MDNLQNNIGFFPQMPVCDRRLSSEISSDFTLPDYKSEIKRLLCSHAIVMPPNEYIGNGSAEINGEVLYRVLYLGADGELYNALLNDKYSIAVPLEFTVNHSNPDKVCFLPICSVESVNARVLGPRKLNLRSKVGCRALAFSPALHTPNTAGVHNPSSVEHLIDETHCINFVHCKSEPQLFIELVAFDSDVDSLRIIDNSAEVVIGECISSLDKINVKGDIMLKVLYCNDALSEAPQVLNRRIPFSSVIYCEGAIPGLECMAYGHILNQNVKIEENGVTLEVEMMLHALAQGNVAVPFVMDSYSTERLSETESKQVHVMCAHKCANGNLTQNDIISLDNAKIPPEAKIIDVWSKAEISQMLHEKGKLVLSGKCMHQILYYFDEEYHTKNLELPVRYELDCKNEPTQDNALCWHSTANIYSTRVRTDTERLFIDCELSFAIFVQATNEIEVLERISFGEKREKTNGEMVICYPSKEASLWSISKHYGESRNSIKNKNGIAEGEEAPKKKFLVI